MSTMHRLMICALVGLSLTSGTASAQSSNTSTNTSTNTSSDPYSSNSSSNTSSNSSDDDGSRGWRKWRGDDRDCRYDYRSDVRDDGWYAEGREERRSYRRGDCR